MTDTQNVPLASPTEDVPSPVPSHTTTQFCNANTLFLIEEFHRKFPLASPRFPASACMDAFVEIVLCLIRENELCGPRVGKMCILETLYDFVFNANTFFVKTSVLFREVLSTKLETLIRNESCHPTPNLLPRLHTTKGRLFAFLQTLDEEWEVATDEQRDVELTEGEVEAKKNV